MANALFSRSALGFGGINTPAAASNFAIAASTSGWASGFQPYSTDPITHLGFRYGARTGTPPTYKIGLEGLDTGGLPDGADVGGGSPTFVNFTPPADTSIDGLWQWKQLTNAYTPTRGQFLASVIRYASGTADGSNNSSFTRDISQLVNSSRGFPYVLTMTASAWSKAAGAVMGWRTASGRFGAISQSNYATATANTATHKSGMFFTLPAEWGSTFQLIGLNLNGKIGAAAGSAKVGVWDTSGNELQSTTLDSDFTGSVGQTVNSGQLITFSNSTLATLSYGTKYYCGLEVISGTCIMTGIVLAEAADASAWPNGTNRGLMTYDGAFHETATTLPLCELIFADTTPGGGGASAVLYGQEGLRLL